MWRPSCRASLGARPRPGSAPEKSRQGAAEKEIWTKAAVFHRQLDLRVDDVPEPESRPGGVKTAIVFGSGPIGATTVQCLRAGGASLVVVAEVADQRKEMARNIGADVVINPTQEDVAEAVEKLTDGLGVDAAFDAAGAQETFRTAFQATARGGKVVNVAVWEQEIELDPNDMVLSEVEVIGSIAYRNE